MSINSLNSASATTSGRTTLSERIQTAGDKSESAIASIASAAADGVSATVSFSSRALHALEDAGQAVLGGAEDLAVGAWHAIESAEDVGEAVADKIGSGAKSVAKEVGHYAEVGLQAVGAAATDVASGAVMAASAVGKSLSALI